MGGISDITTTPLLPPLIKVLYDPRFNPPEAPWQTVHFESVSTHSLQGEVHDEQSAPS